MDRTNDSMSRKSRAASILVFLQPALTILAVTAYIIARIVLWIKDSIAEKQGLQIPFREGGPEFLLFAAITIVLAIGFFTAVAALIVRRNIKGWDKPYVLPLAIVETVLGIPALYVIISLLM